MITEDIYGFSLIFFLATAADGLDDVWVFWLLGTVYILSATLETTGDATPCTGCWLD